ncbi:MAG: hypothetical protein WCO45_14180 [Pseudanabaena sp. ELA607]|jgi:hypothetical protein
MTASKNTPPNTQSSTQASAQESVLAAIERLQFRVTIADVATNAGLDLNTSQREVLAIAQATNGHLQVAQSGEIAYKFDPKVRQILVNRSFNLKLQAWLKEVSKVTFFLLRISFGIMLLVAIVVVVLGIILALLLMQNQNRSHQHQPSRRTERRYNSQRDRNQAAAIVMMGGFSNPFGNPVRIFGYNKYGYFYYASFGGNAKKSKSKAKGSIRDRQAQVEAPSMGFFEGVFSFLFGDGNPNFNLEERRWQNIGALIRTNQGVITAEQALPFLDPTTVQENTTTDAEDFMLPVLVKFNGQPQVSASGDLVYAFPDLQKVANDQETNLMDLEGYLKERKWPFSMAGKGNIIGAIILGIFYLGSSIYLGYLIRDPKIQTMIGDGFLGFVGQAYWFLLGYAILFLAIPVVRYGIWGNINRKVTARNQLRARQAEVLSQPNEVLQGKLDFAKQLAITPEIIDDQNLAYNTESDLVDQID